MADFKPEKGSTVEVSSEEPGFHGAWYVATLMDVLDSSPYKRKSSDKKNRNRRKMGYLVKYETLFEDDNLDKHLTEVVDPSCVRPLPPRNGRRNNDNEVVADAEGGGDFQPFDVIDAFHRDGWWIGEVRKVIADGEIRKYIVSFETPPEEVEFERSQLRLHVDWIDCRWQVPPKKIPEQEIAVTPSSKEGQFSVKKKRSSRKKDHIRNTKIGNLVEEDSHGSNGNSKVMMSMMETSGTQVIDQDSVLVEEEMIIENNEAENSQSKQTRKRGRPPKLQVIRPSGSLEDGSNMNSSRINDLDEQPLSVWYQGLNPSSVLKRSLCCSPDESSGEPAQQTIVNNGGTTTITTTVASTNYQQDWPFIKQSPIWATIESLAMHQSFTQKPHFSPLENIRDDLREGLAIAQMVTYGNLVHKIQNFKLTDSIDVLNKSLQTLGELETHGFNVCGIRARLNKLLSLKSELNEQEDKKKKAEKEVEKMELNKAVVEEEINQLELKMQKLKEKLVQHHEETTSLQSNLQLVSKKIMDCERVFEELAATPL